QFLITDGETFFHEERRALTPTVHSIENSALGLSVLMSDPAGRYQLRKQIITDPFQNTLLIRTSVDAAPEWLRRLRVFVLCAPHINVAGAHNNAEVLFAQRRTFLTAWREDTHVMLGATLPFSRTSVGYVGASDGFQDLQQDKQMSWHFDYAPDGNLAMMGEIDIRTSPTFTLGVGFASSRQSALATLLQSLSVPFEKVRDNFVKQWATTSKRFTAGEGEYAHDPHLFANSVNILLAHEDKSFPGALIAGMTIPWGEIKGDEDLGGYHLVWSRDMCQSATALLTVGDVATPLRSLIYLAVTQLEDGCFYQNFWIDGRPYWSGVQLDEVAFPIILAWRLQQAGALEHFDPLGMVNAAIGFLLTSGPMTKQDRWEEASGHSPSTLAAVIAGLVCGAEFLRADGDDETADFVLEFTDFLNANVEKWTVANSPYGTHYMRVNPAPFDAEDYSDEDTSTGVFNLANQPPGARYQYPANEIVDAGFLELARYGVRRAGAQLFEDSLAVVDRLLKVDLPQGPCWKRYNHDGYGQKDDGTGFDGWGVGRPWPLLTGERAHYELAAGRDAVPLLKTYERFANGAGLFPEQVWDIESATNPRMRLGKPTGSAIPLCWAHAEYIKLVRSIQLGCPVDRIAPVWERYGKSGGPAANIEVWNRNRHPRNLAAGKVLRIIFREDFFVRSTDDDWATQYDHESRRNALNLHYVDLPAAEQSRTTRFTLFWKVSQQWEGREYRVTST
ncbi:MAG TPA: glycoside hydrolase family 15 protein, partial [Terriglobales bacterium]